MFGLAIVRYRRRAGRCAWTRQDWLTGPRLGRARCRNRRVSLFELCCSRLRTARQTPLPRKCGRP
jgi:hypothetical protein